MVVRYQGYDEAGQKPTRYSFVFLNTHVAIVVRVLGVTTGGNSRVRSNARVDGVDGAESVDVNLQVRQSLIGARLESEGITSCRGVESMNGG